MRRPRRRRWGDGGCSTTRRRATCGAGRSSAATTRRRATCGAGRSSAATPPLPPPLPSMTNLSWRWSAPRRPSASSAPASNRWPLRNSRLPTLRSRPSGQWRPSGSPRRRSSTMRSRPSRQRRCAPPQWRRGGSPGW